MTPAPVSPSPVHAPVADITAPLTIPGTTLTSRVRSGVGWMAASTLLTQIFALVRQIALARLLSRDDFGLFGMATTIFAALVVLTQIGLDNSIVVQKFKSDQEMHEQLDTVWTAQLGQKLLLCLLLLAAVYPTAKFYGDDRLLRILPVLAMTPLVTGFNNIGIVLLKRDVQYARIFWFEQSYAVVSTVVVLALGFWTRSFWALVWGQVVSSILNVLMSYVLHSYRPRFAFKRDAFDRAFSFGKHVFVIGVMAYITTTADNIFVGKILGTVVLGGYVVAYTIANLPGAAIASMLGNVMLSAFSELNRDNQARLERAMVRVFTVTSALLVLATVPMVLLSPEIIAVLYGAKWAAAAPVLRVLMLVGFFRGLLQILSPLIVGMNRPDLEARSKLIEAIVFVVILGPMTLRFGAIGAAWAGVIIYLLSLLIRFHFARQLIAATSKVPPLIATAMGIGIVGAIVGALALKLVPDASAVWPRLLLGGTASVGTCLLLMAMTWPALRFEAREVLGPLWVKLRRSRHAV